MPADISFDKHIRLIHSFAYKVQARLWAAGNRTTQFEDIVSELSVAWCLARDNWSPKYEVPFTAYLKRGMINHINRWAKGEIANSGGSHMALDAPLGQDDNDGLGHEAIADPAAIVPEDMVAFKDAREKALAKMSPRTRQFVLLLESPPKCLQEVLTAMRARQEYAHERGIPRGAVPKRIMPNLIFQFMGVSRVEQTKITGELEKLFKVKASLSAMDRVSR